MYAMTFYLGKPCCNNHLHRNRHVVIVTVTQAGHAVLKRMHTHARMHARTHARTHTHTHTHTFHLPPSSSLIVWQLSSWGQTRWPSWCWSSSGHSSAADRGWGWRRGCGHVHTMTIHLSTPVGSFASLTVRGEWGPQWGGGTLQFHSHTRDVPRSTSVCESVTCTLWPTACAVTSYLCTLLPLPLQWTSPPWPLCLAPAVWSTQPCPPRRTPTGRGKVNGWRQLLTVNRGCFLLTSLNLAMYASKFLLKGLFSAGDGTWWRKEGVTMRLHTHTERV